MLTTRPVVMHLYWLQARLMQANAVCDAVVNIRSTCGPTDNHALSQGRLGFAGEHTSKAHLDTVGGAMLTGLREAVRVLGMLTTARAPPIEEEEDDEESSEVCMLGWRFYKFGGEFCFALSGLAGT